jgi:hypothetical protein
MSWAAGVSYGLTGIRKAMCKLASPFQQACLQAKHRIEELCGPGHTQWRDPYRRAARPARRPIRCDATPRSPLGQTIR